MLSLEYSLYYKIISFSKGQNS